MRFAFRRATPSNVVVFPTEGTAVAIDRTAAVHARITLGIVLFFTVLAATPIGADRMSAPSCKPLPALLHHHGAK